MAKIICIANSKGGVGKTTTAVNLGAYLAAFGRRVLLIDFDPQANASSALGHNPNRDVRSIYDGILDRVSFADLLKQSSILNYHFIPSHPNLAGLLVELVSAPEREKALKKFIEPIRESYDYIIIDSPPSLSLLTINGLMAADYVLIPVQSEYYSLEGLGQLLTTIDLIGANLGHKPNIMGAVITMYDKRERLSRDVARNLRRYFPHRVFNVEIPRAVGLAEAPGFSRTILNYDPYSSGALAYRRLAEEIIDLEGIA